MDAKIRNLLILETIAIFALIGALIVVHYQPKQKYGLLSPGVYANADSSVPKGFAIQNLDPIQKELESYISANNLNISIYLQNTKNGASMSVNRQNFYPASINKMPVAILIMELVENDKLDMSTKLPIADADRNSKFGSIYNASYSELTVKELIEAMLKQSDDTALNVLYEQVNKEDMAALLDYYNIDFNSNYHFPAIINQGNSELTNPKTISNMFSSLYFSTVLEPKDSEYVLSLLTQTEFNLTKIADFHDKTVIAQKHGVYYDGSTKLFHDCGIIYVEKSRFTYCIMTSGMEVDEAQRATVVIVRKIHDYIVQTRLKLDAYREHLDNP